MSFDSENTVEKIILRDSKRGMKLLAPFLSESFCMYTARKILSVEPKKAIIVTGFYVGGHPETDGPSGALTLASALRALGFKAVIATDEPFADIFRGYADVIAVPLKSDEKYMHSLLKKLNPSVIVSIERCGRNKFGHYLNMRGEDIGEFTAPLDLLFEKCEGNIFTIGIGDGGNEIGMGILENEIREKLKIEPCTVKTDSLIIASSSNIGAYGLISCLSSLSGCDLLPNQKELFDIYRRLFLVGCVDGILGMPALSADGFSEEYEFKIMKELRA